MKNEARIAAIQQMLLSQPNDVFLTYALGLEYACHPSTYQLAEAQFLAAITLQQNYVAAYYQLGQLYADMQKPEQALERYREALQVAKDNKDRKAMNEIEEAIFLLSDD